MGQLKKPPIVGDFPASHVSLLEGTRFQQGMYPSRIQEHGQWSTLISAGPFFPMPRSVDQCCKTLWFNNMWLINYDPNG